MQDHAPETSSTNPRLGRRDQLIEAGRAARKPYTNHRNEMNEITMAGATQLRLPTSLFQEPSVLTMRVLVPKQYTWHSATTQEKFTS